jgi:hypothetical protein
MACHRSHARAHFARWHILHTKVYQKKNRNLSFTSPFKFLPFNLSPLFLFIPIFSLNLFPPFSFFSFFSRFSPFYLFSFSPFSCFSPFPLSTSPVSSSSPDSSCSSFSLFSSFSPRNLSFTSPARAHFARWPILHTKTYQKQPHNLSLISPFKFLPFNLSPFFLLPSSVPACNCSCN